MIVLGLGSKNGKLGCSEKVLIGQSVVGGDLRLLKDKVQKALPGSRQQGTARQTCAEPAGWGVMGNEGEDAFQNNMETHVAK